MAKYRITCVVGTRPNFIKMAPVVNALQQSGNYQVSLVHTGQHYDDFMSTPFFKELNIPEPDHFLEARSGSHAIQFASIMPAFEHVLKQHPTDMVVVAGDVNSTLACALTAAKMKIPVAHIESGLRSNDRSMPEEVNRIMTDAISDVLLAPSDDAVTNLRKENIPEERIALVGNVMIDTLRTREASINALGIPASMHVERGKYALLTMHRPSNVDNPLVLKKILEVILEVASEIPVVFPVHPRTRKLMEDQNLIALIEQQKGLRLVTPLSYQNFSALLKNARFVLTDSGGVQEETTVWGVPCITLRENTERPLTITQGSSELAGSDPERIRYLSQLAISGKWKDSSIPDLWDGLTSGRIVDAIDHYFSV